MHPIIELLGVLTYLLLIFPPLWIVWLGVAAFILYKNKFVLWAVWLSFNVISFVCFRMLLESGSNLI